MVYYIYIVNTLSHISIINYYLENIFHSRVSKSFIHSFELDAFYVEIEQFTYEILLSSLEYSQNDDNCLEELILLKSELEERYMILIDS